MPSSNIIQFHAESWDGRLLGCMDFHPAMANATPNIDKLAAAGTIFENTYCTNPICCPSRANMLSGTYTHTCESWSNFKGLEKGMWTYHAGLAETHDTLLLGKHFDHLTGSHTIMNRVADFLEPLNDEAYPVMNADTAQSYHVDPGREREYHQGDWGIAKQAIAFIRDRKADDRPFFISLNPGLVHAAFHTNQYWLEQIPEELVDTPPIDETNHPANEYQKKSKAWRHGFDDQTIKTVRRIYFAMCAEADAIVGHIMDALEEARLADSTTVMFSSDHGEMALEHQQYYKMSHFEASSRVPLILRGPGIQAGQRITTPVSLIDFAPTFCELGGLDQRDCFEGESLLPLAKGITSESRAWALSSYAGVTSNTFSWMLRKGDYKLIVYEGYDSRLFNIAKDPTELNDLIDEQPDIVAEMLAIIDAEVDREATLKVWEDWRRQSFAQFQRQAKRGLYHEGSYGLMGHPSSDYHTIVDNALTGWNAADEARTTAWINEK